MAIKLIKKKLIFILLGILISFTFILFILADSEISIPCSSDSEISISCGFSNDEINIFGGRDSAPPIITITNPGASETFTNNVSIKLNYSIIEYSPDKTCWFKVVDSSDNLEINNQSLTDCANTTFNLPGSDSYNLTLYANDTFGNTNHSSVFFRVSLEAPAVNLNQPSDEQWLKYNTSVYFNFTATDFDGIENCELWSNFSGTWALNENFTFIISGVQKNTTKNISESTHKWNVKCIDTTDLSDFALTNYTVHTDLTPPIPIFISSNNSETPGLTYTFSYNITDARSIDTCSFTLRDANDNLHNYNANTSMDCGTDKNRTVTVFDIGTYTITITGNDKAGNSNSTSMKFTSTSQEGGGGGAGGVSVRGLEEAKNFSITTRNFQDKTDLILPKKSTRPRTQEFILTNRELKSVTVNIACNVENSSESTERINMCNYIKFSQETFTIPANEQETLSGKFSIRVPENASIGDQYFFNVVALSSDEKSFSKLSVVARVTLLGIIYEWNNLPFQEDKLESERTAYPVFWVSSIFSFIFFILSILIFASRKMPVAGTIVSVIVFSSSFVLFLFIL